MCDASAPWPIRWYDTIDSTNAEARRLIAAGLADACWVAAGEQTAGRGRLGRVWMSSRGNVFASAVFPFDGSVGQATRLTLAAAIAVADTVKAIVPGARPELKWPNDVRVERRKLSGILVETVAHEGRLWVIVGIGINLATSPETAGQPAICLRALGAPDMMTPRAVIEILDHKLRSEVVAAQAAYPVLLSRWSDLAEDIGRVVEVKSGGEVISGVFEGLDPTGALCLRLPDGHVRVIVSGETGASGGEMG